MPLSFKVSSECLWSILSLWNWCHALLAEGTSKIKTLGMAQGDGAHSGGVLSFPSSSSAIASGQMGSLTYLVVMGGYWTAVVCSSFGPAAGSSS